VRHRVFIVALALLSGLAPDAAAQVEFGARAGVSGDPSQFIFGGHFETDPLVERLTFRPNLEVGIGDDRMLIALNVEFAWRVPLQRQPWSVYFGGGPAVNAYFFDSNLRRGDSSDVGGGFNILVGLEHDKGLFTELKVGAIDSPGIRFLVGYVFGR